MVEPFGHNAKVVTGRRPTTYNLRLNTRRGVGGPHWIPCVRGRRTRRAVGQCRGASDGKHPFRRAHAPLIASCGQPGRRTRTNARGGTFKGNGASQVRETVPIRQQRSTHAAFLTERLWRCGDYCRTIDELIGLDFPPGKPDEERDNQRPSLPKCLDSSGPDSISFMLKNVGGRSA